MPKAGPSLHTGAQTIKKRKPGTRLTGGNVFQGQGKTLHDGDMENTGFGRRVASKRAREERALAAEERIRASHAQALSTAEASTSTTPQDAPRTDITPRFEEVQGTSRKPLRNYDPDDSGSETMSYQTPTTTVDLGETTLRGSQGHSKRKRKDPDTWSKTPPEASLHMGKLVQMEMVLRKKESLGMAHTQPPRRLGGRVSSKKQTR